MSKPFTRRRALGAFGAVSLGGLLAACGDDDDGSGSSVTTTDGQSSTVETKSTSRLTVGQFDSAATCEVATELTEGPYYFDVDAIRSDIREDREGTLLVLGVRVRDAEQCEPIENAIVDIWHCDALGTYSGFESAAGETYLRGAQATNADGIVEFKTVYPGWYPGRTTHIHAKVHLDKSTLLTTQFFTNQDTDDAVYSRTPYNEDTGRDAFNDSDGIYVPEGELTLSEDGEDIVGLITLDVRRS